MSFSPVLLVVVSLVCYQLAAKLAPAEVTPWVTLAAVYAIAFCLSLWRALTDGQAIAAGSLVDVRFLVTALVLGLAVVGIEYGYLAAHRSGWQLAVVGLVGAAGGTAVLTRRRFGRLQRDLATAGDPRPGAVPRRPRRHGVAPRPF